MSVWFEVCFLLIFAFGASSIQTVANSIDDVSRELRRVNDMREYAMRSQTGYEPPDYGPSNSDEKR